MNLRMQLLMRQPERSQRDADELKQLEVARQKIIAAGQPVPVSSLPLSRDSPRRTAGAGQCPS